MTRRQRQLLAVLPLPFAAALWVAGCAPCHRWLDRSTLTDKAEIVRTRGDRGPVRRPFPFSDAASLQALTAPTPIVDARVEPLTERRLEREGLVQERVSFESALRVKHPESNVARLYVYRQGPLGARPVVLWVPGLYVSDTAFRFIDRFFEDALDAGADVVLLVPPYHLERTPAGFETGDALLATDVHDNLAALAQGLSDTRRTLQWLRATGSPRIGAFGGSLGANWLLRTATWDDGLDFLTLMIPLVRWDDVLLRPEEFGPVRERFTAAGVDETELRALYASFDATGSPPRLAPERISVLGALHDQVTARAPIEALAAAWGLSRIAWFERGHATMLLTPSLYDRYAALVREDLASSSAPGVP